MASSWACARARASWSRGCAQPAAPTRKWRTTSAHDLDLRRAEDPQARIDDFIQQLLGQVFFLWWSLCQSTGKRLDLLGQWTLKKRLAGATSEPIPSCPSCVCDWEHLDELYFQDPVVQCVDTCTFLAVTCATSYSIINNGGFVLQQGERHFLKQSVCLTLFHSFTIEFFGKKSTRSGFFGKKSTRSGFFGKKSTRSVFFSFFKMLESNGGEIDLPKG